MNTETPILTGKQLILATKVFAQEHRRKSWFVLFSTSFLFLTAIAGTIWGHYLFLRLTCSVLLGLLMMRMFIIYHDYQHHTILQKSVLARWVMNLYGLYILAPASIWKRSHDYHHQNNSKLFSASIGSYPIATKKKFAAMNAKERLAYLGIRHPVFLFFGYITIFIIGMCGASFGSTPRKHWDSLVALVLHLAYTILIFLLLGPIGWLATIVIPFMITGALGAYLFYAQHNFPGVVFNSNEDWTYEKAAMASSSYMKMGPVMQWFSGNIGYHHIHHLNARIPFYRLPEAYVGIRELRNAKETSLRFSDICACLRLKIWDPEQQRMISLKEYRCSCAEQNVMVVK